MKEFHYKYSNYTLDRIADIYFKKTATDILEKAPNNEVKDKLEKVLYEGGFDEFSVNSKLMNHDGPSYEAQRRECLAGLLLSDQKTFDVIAKNNILLFHGTNSTALPDILQNGIYSEEEILKRGQPVVTGEFNKDPRQFRPYPRDFISFTDQIDLALQYATLQPTSQAKEENSFGVLIGMSTDDFDEEGNGSRGIRAKNIASNTPEIGFIGHIPREYIKLIAVPQIHAQEVQDMINEYELDGVNVVPAEGIVSAVIEAKKYYYNYFEITPDCMEITGKKDGFKQFGSSDLKKVAEERKVSKIRRIFNSLKLKINQKIKDEKDDEYSKN